MQLRPKRDDVDDFNANFRPDAETKIIIHGWRSSTSSDTVQNIKDAYLYSMDCNIIGKRICCFFLFVPITFFCIFQLSIGPMLPPIPSITSRPHKHETLADTWPNWSTFWSSGTKSVPDTFTSLVTAWAPMRPDTPARLHVPDVWPASPDLIRPCQASHVPADPSNDSIRPMPYLWTSFIRAVDFWATWIRSDTLTSIRTVADHHSPVARDLLRHWKRAATDEVISSLPNRLTPKWVSMRSDVNHGTRTVRANVGRVKR